jgi:predicted transposase/invertase (TIGR01784 family)
VFHITEKETGFYYFKDLELHTVELKKFIGEDNNELSELVNKVKASLDMWSAFLTRHDLLVEDKLPRELDKPELKKALHVLETLNFAEEEWQAYEDRLKWLRVETNTLKNYFEKGKVEGIEQGRAEGMEEGIGRGIKMGEQAALIKIATALLAEGTPVEKISHLTGLTESEIKELANQS